MISIIIPAYNEEKNIAQTLQKFRQEFTAVPYEIIVSDDQSTDATAALAAPYADKVVLCPPGRHTTIGGARNRGAAATRYDYLVFLDSGVVIPDPNRFFKSIVAGFLADPRLLGLTVKLRIDPAVATRADNFFYWLIDFWIRLNVNWLGWGYTYGKFQAVRADAFKQAGGFDETLVAAEDSDLFHRLSRLGRTHWNPALTVFHAGRREHAWGWPRLLFVWVINGLSMAIFKRSVTKEWGQIR
jgi:glycosyltransferase involved in cell wall biosynthesis